MCSAMHNAGTAYCEIHNTNELDENVNGLIIKFTDDRKMDRVVNSEEDCQRIQWDIDQL